jgi:membrane protease YdiL (CAAX protease family)
MEELFFRGFLYPVLARRFGFIMAVLLTALPFACIHIIEYKAWAPVLIVFLVGVVLTVVRAKRQSVASSFIVHSIYNGIPVLATIIASGGYRHLEKLTP